MTPADSLIRRAFEAGNPVVDGNRATFFWEGEFAPQLISDLSGWEDRPKPFKRVSPGPKFGSDRPIWSCSLSLPRDAYLEYAFFDPNSQEKILDPLNGQTVSNGVGSRNNFFYMPESTPSPLAVRRADVRSGTLTRHRVDADLLRDNGERDVYLYQPPTGGAVPLLVVYDGSDYFQRGKLATIVDNLIAAKRIRPIAMAFLQNGKSRRTVEYFCSDATIAWLDQEVLPLAREHLRLLKIEQQPGAYGVLGASAGGLMSMYTGLRMSEIFGKVLCQAGLFSLDGRDFAVTDLVRYNHARDLKIWMDVGTLDDLLEDNRRMIALLDRKRYNVTYREFSAGHNYTAWRDDVWRGLEEMFPPTSR
ncbi:MAG: alpha/beta hydrolase [Anaerolineales bacterium]